MHTVHNSALNLGRASAHRAEMSLKSETGFCTLGIGMPQFLGKFFKFLDGLSWI